MRTLVVVLLLLLCAGCRTMQPVNHSDWSAVPSRVEAGDTVEVQTRDGQTRRFQVTAVESDAIAGEGLRIPAHEIAALQVLAVSKGRAAGITLGSIALGYVLLSALAAVLVVGAL